MITSHQEMSMRDDSSPSDNIDIIAVPRESRPDK